MFTDAPSKEKVAVAGLARLAGGIFFVGGGFVGTKGVWDWFRGVPVAHFFSQHSWSFVTQTQWARFAVFELTVGLACAGLGWAAWVYSYKLPTWIERTLP